MYYIYHIIIYSYQVISVQKRGSVIISPGPKIWRGARIFEKTLTNYTRITLLTCISCFVTNIAILRIIESINLNWIMHFKIQKNHLSFSKWYNIIIGTSKLKKLFVYKCLELKGPHCYYTDIKYSLYYIIL